MSVFLLHMMYRKIRTQNYTYTPSCFILCTEFHGARMQTKHCRGSRTVC
jgi:hypothetical protein